MPNLKNTTEAPKLTTKIGLEIHVQLKTASKMFCRCDNNAEAKEPNTVVCPVCLGLPGALPVANKQAVLWTIKAGLALGCTIPKIAKFDRKHYFYPDLPKGYQISQYDEPFCVGGGLEIDGRKIRLNRIHLEEDAGKLIHKDGKSLVDLNRAGTPLMEIVTEPDLISPKEAGDFLRKLQKIVRDVVQVSEASMEKGHLRCDANISVSTSPTNGSQGKMSPIIEIKNLNSFRFVEKALSLVEEKLKDEYQEWPEKNSKETWGYDSVNNKVYLQRRKEEAADYRYFPEPDLPPFDTTDFNLASLQLEIRESADEILAKLNELGVSSQYASKIVNREKYDFFIKLIEQTGSELANKAAKITSEYVSDPSEALKYLQHFIALVQADVDFQKQSLTKIIALIMTGKTFAAARAEVDDSMVNQNQLESIVDQVIKANSNELARYQAGEKQLFGFFMGQLMKETKCQADAKEANKLLREKLEKK